ncbi:rod shape-determining protein MreC [Hydrogenibacillus sp. N12]|uniref:rod shape-determining protein MreC n=1 Tax=Hydrogenibacillus sp. N12 TaxID=2866627 RepID=UPI001C7CFF57|nr:rod shape-determining protein MreC [Hydrogenibacillus sp. N12]QZA33752.1 rod shape-determining protein MreC [Hydrogenibacillus sp. N12]
MPRLGRLLIVFFLAAALLAASLAFTPVPRGALSLPERMIKDVAGFGAWALSAPAGWVKGWAKRLADLKDTYAENAALKRSLVSYARLKADYDLLKAENERLRALLDLKTTSRDYALLAAEVIGREEETWMRSLVVGRGETDGVRPKEAVLASGGALVGVVERVGAFTSDVRLITDLEGALNIAAMTVGPTPAYGVIDGYDAERGLLAMSKIPLDVDVPLGSTVVTSGLGGVLPKGLLIGRVERVVPAADMLTRTAYVKPAADLYHLDWVLIARRLDRTVDTGGGRSAEGGAGR